MSRRATTWIKMIAAIVAGNAVYFALESRLPAAAQHAADGPDLGTLVDFWFCLAAWGLIDLAASWLKRSKR